MMLKGIGIDSEKKINQLLFHTQKNFAHEFT